MSMEVDFSTPLTDQERAFLLERGRYADIERADSAHGTSTPDELLRGDGSGPGTKPLLTGERIVARREELLAELAALDAADGVDDEEDGELPPYEDWKVPELDKELAARGLPVQGNKSEKVQALYDDDSKVSE
jgi:hypothetical protein